LDSSNQESGNMRNKIIKFGANVALQRGDLAVGYVSNISKAGCFIQIGHNCVVRAGLNELSDGQFDFEKLMPVGRLVVGRVTRVHDTPSGDKRFDFSVRESLVTYGVGTIERSKLEVGQEVESVVMAVAEGKAFAQIKGSYIQIKVKGHDKLKVGDHVKSKLKKVTKEKISSEFLSKTSGKAAASPSELKYQSLYRSIVEEALKSLDSLHSHFKGDKKKSDFDISHINQQNFMNNEDQIAAHIRDLKELQDDEQPDDEEMDSDGSDAEIMKRIIYEDNLDESGEDEMMESEGQESE